jgi:hypothetical protein
VQKSGCTEHSSGRFLQTVAKHWPGAAGAVKVASSQQIHAQEPFMEARNTQQYVNRALTMAHRGIDAVADWVTALSWWKFFLFAALALIAASILQDELFSGSVEEIVIEDRARGDKARRGEPNIMIDDSGIHFNPRKSGAKTPKDPAAPPAPPEPPADPDAPEAGEPVDMTDPAAIAGAEAGAKGKNKGKAAITANNDSVHIELPPQIGEELSNAIEAAVEDAAERKTVRYHKQASTWFTSFVTLLILALFATKALASGKKRAELVSEQAWAAAERESMQRQLSEAKMQMMQAQVEPHFLFNTLASVEHLIQVDPPRASAMQRSLIQYLRAVLPQMRDNTVISNLGRETDMVAAYLNLLKMRMEERLTVKIDVPDFLRSCAFPPMMLQSMVENAIKHGLETKPDGGTISVTAKVYNDQLCVTVADDGVGFGVVPSTGTGTGLTNIRERLKMLHGSNARLDIAPNSPSGVIATIEVPFSDVK